MHGHAQCAIISMWGSPLFPFFCCFICHRYWRGKFTLTKALVRLKSMTHAWPCTMCHYFHVRFTSQHAWVVDRSQVSHLNGFWPSWTDEVCVFKCDRRGQVQFDIPQCHLPTCMSHGQVQCVWSSCSHQSSAGHFVQPLPNCPSNLGLPGLWHFLRISLEFDQDTRAQVVPNSKFACYPNP